MAWYRADNSLAQHMKTIRLQRRLGIGISRTVGMLHLLWGWASQNRPDGDLSTLDADDLALVMDWDGDPQDLLDALMAEGTGKRGFLDPDGRLHEWDEYQLVSSRNSRKVAGGLFGAHVRYHVNKGVRDSGCAFCTDLVGGDGLPSGPNGSPIGDLGTPRGDLEEPSKTTPNLESASTDLVGGDGLPSGPNGSPIGQIATCTYTSTSKNSPPLKPPLSLVPSGETFAPDGASHTPDPTPDDGFDGFWDAYPKRDGSKGSKAEAKAAWGRLSKAARGRAMTAVGHYAAWCEASGSFPKDAVRFIRPVRGAKTALFEEWQEPRPVQSRPGTVLITSEADRHNPDAWSLASLEQP